MAAAGPQGAYGIEAVVPKTHKAVTPGKLSGDSQLITVFGLTITELDRTERLTLVRLLRAYDGSCR
jgi:hypothetical protein